MEELVMTAAQLSALEWTLIGALRLDEKSAYITLCADAQVSIGVNATLDLDDMSMINLEVRPLACVIAGEVMPGSVTRSILEESIFFSEAWQQDLKIKLAM